MTPDLPRLAAVAVGMLVAMALQSGAAQCERVDHDGQGYVLCQVEAAQEPALRLFQDGPDGAPLRNFANVRRTLDAGQTLSFAMNAGMFHADYRPVGLLVVDGVELSPIVTGASRDNFGMLPNGVFCTGGAQPFQVIESNGVGVSPDGQTAWFAISNRPVTFHEFGRFFRDGLGVRDALYFDGSISRLYAPSVNRADFGRSMGPIIGLVE